MHVLLLAHIILYLRLPNPEKLSQDGTVKLVIEERMLHLVNTSGIVLDVQEKIVRSIQV